jgi:hypothetical protein
MTSGDDFDETRALHTSLLAHLRRHRIVATRALRAAFSEVRSALARRQVTFSQRRR